MSRVGGFAADASIVGGSDFVPDDFAGNHHRVGGGAANPTASAPVWTRVYNGSANRYCIQIDFDTIVIAFDQCTLNGQPFSTI